MLQTAGHDERNHHDRKQMIMSVAAFLQFLRAASGALLALALVIYFVFPSSDTGAKTALELTILVDAVVFLLSFPAIAFMKRKKETL